MKAIILAGGLGTRLRPVLQDVPKPMAPIKGKPFLEYLLEYLYKQNIVKVIMSVGFKHDTIEEYFGSNYKDIKIEYSVEAEPLGTGGAIRKAFEKVEEENVLIINGDTFFNLDVGELFDRHISLNADLTIALKPMMNFDRYGSVEIKGNKVKSFVEKSFFRFGYINGGVYIVKSSLFKRYALPEKFSFETNFLMKYVNILDIYSYVSDGYFVDIGVPEDYKLAQKELKNYV